MLQSKEEMLSARLQKQLDDFIHGLVAYNNLRIPERRRSNDDYEFLRDFFKRFFTDRNARASEVASSAYKKVQADALSQFPVQTFWNLCMDGRVKTVLTNGATAGIGASIRVPGGTLREFVRDENGNFTLLSDSNFATLVHRALVVAKSDVLVEVFDSHIGCAARNAEEEARGRTPKDMGLLSDILHKQEMLEALHNYVTSQFGEKKQVIGIQTSFDPHNGFMYMGLETDAALAVAKAVSQEKTKQHTAMHRWEYTSEILVKLVREEKIISTEALAHTPALEKLFRVYAFSSDWATEYTKAAAQFWNGIAAMKDIASPVIEAKLLAIYPQLQSQDTLAVKELQERVMLLLTNAFSGFIHNQQAYPYSVHREECIKISRGGYPPYEISAFVLLGSDEKNLCINIELAAMLVRQNRKQGRVKDRSGLFTDPEVFAQVPVPLIIQTIAEEPLDPKKWENLSNIDWDDLPKNWDRISEREFFNYLETKGELPLTVAVAINDLRRRMAILFDPDQVIAGRLVSHHKVAVPVVVGGNRRNYFIVPFVKHGF